MPLPEELQTHLLFHGHVPELDLYGVLSLTAQEDLGLLAAPQRVWYSSATVQAATLILAFPNFYVLHLASLLVSQYRLSVYNMLVN